MKHTFAAIALAASALANPMPQGVTSAIAPQATAPAGCSNSRSGTFEISVVNVTTSKRSIEKRQQAGILTLTLGGGILKDQAGRTGYIASNYQFQFDSPPQTGAIYTSGFSVCSNQSLALGGSTIFYQCYSGGFYNLYDRSWASQCSPIYLVAQNPGGRPVPTQATDGQPGVPTTVPPVSRPPISQISDGQPQQGTRPPVTQISDGQIQGPTPRPPVTQISDGQIQNPTGKPPVSQISDGQVQAPKPTPTPTPSVSGPRVSQISDGQPQVVTPTVTRSVAPIGTGNFTMTSSRLPVFTGAAASPIYGLGAIAAGLMGAAALL